MVDTKGDPKFWSPWLRYGILCNISLLVFLANMYVAGITTGFVPLAIEFQANFSQLGDQVSYPVLMLGLGNIIWTPTAIIFGKRPTIIVAGFMFLAASIWSCKATSLNSLLASRIVGGFAGGSIDSLGPAIIADLFMEKYFATSMAIFSLFLGGGSQVGPLIAGFLIQDKGWRWLFILTSILVGFNLLLLIVFLPETNYRRVMYLGETADEVDKHAVEHSEHKVEDPELARIETINVPAYTGSYWKDLVSFRNRGEVDASLKNWIHQFTLPFRFLLVPHALYATLAYGIVLGGVVASATLNPEVLSPPPYLLTSSGLGVFGVATFAGIVIGYPLAGPVTDLLSRFMARLHSNTTHRPEFRLPALILPFMVVPTGLIVWAYTIANGRSIYVAAVGLALQVSGLVFVPSVVLAVVLDGWPLNGSEAVVTINAGKNLIAFAVTLATPTWLENQGLINMMWQLAAMQWAVLFLAIPLYFFGPTLRAKSLRVLASS